MSQEVNLREVIKAIYEDGAAGHVLVDIVNGLNTWLFRVLSEYRINHDQAREQCLRFGMQVTNHLRKIYELERHYSCYRKSLREYLETESQTSRYGLNYTIRSLRSSFRDNDDDYTASLVALLISAKREEQSFEKYREKLSGIDVREHLLSYYQENEELWMGRNGGGRKEEEPTKNEVVLDNRLAFRGFNI